MTIADVDPTDRYVALMRARPRPRGEQIRAFAHFVAHDHSWYKKLPMSGAGEPFFLYLDPHAHGALLDRDDGSQAWREIIRVPGEPAWFPRWGIGLQAGDVEPKIVGLSCYSRGMSTAEYRDRLGTWSYWNWGRPDQPRHEAIAQAAAQLTVRDDDGVAVPVPAEILEPGLVYLRATVYGDMGPMSGEYEALRERDDLPDVAVDAGDQRLELVSAMERVVALIYDS